MATALYCSFDDLLNRLSLDGVTYRLDDGTFVASDGAGGVIEEASRKIDEYCLTNYSEANLAVSPIVKQWCASLAVAMLCERRLNDVPRSAQRRYDETIKKLERIESGKGKISDIPQRRMSAPTGSNLRVRLDPIPHVVVEPSRSPSRNRPQDYGEVRDRLDGLDFNI